MEVSIIAGCLQGNKLKLNCVLSSGDTASPSGKYGTIMTGAKSTMLIQAGA